MSEGQGNGLGLVHLLLTITGLGTPTQFGGSSDVLVGKNTSSRVSQG